jgi:hypothetical protein
MWLGLLASLIFIYPLVEMIEERRLDRAAKRDLAKMIRHQASGHRWDATSGRWIE